jgi:acyl-CoA reductase-like NAD-dependent aldehyde dehydrogenase
MKLISTNPSRNYEVIGEVESSTEQDVKNAVAAAKKAQSNWVALSLDERCAKVKSFSDIAAKRADEIVQLIATETGRPVSSSRGNVTGGLEHFEAYIAMAKEALSPETTLETDTEMHRVYHEPWGVIAAICPWNFPFMNVAWQCGQAMIAGNTVVYKNSEENPLFGKLMEEMVKQSDLPDGIFNFVYGDGQVGEWLARSDVDMISFTGSVQTGHKLTAIAAEKFIPIVTELGGSSPCVVFEDVDITDDLVEFIFNRRFVHSGQICSSIKRLIVHESKFDQVVQKLTDFALSRKLGDANDETTDLGPLVAERQVERLEVQVKDALDKGAKLHCGGKRPQDLKGAYYLPTILTNVKPDMKVWHEETFGPVLPIVAFKTEEEAVELANDTQYGLGAHVSTNDKARFTRVAKSLHSGMVAQNQVNYFNAKNPFGGYKLSGMGRENGIYGFHEVTQLKLVSELK